jgi:DNA-binding response OmpR family regulator
MNIKPRVLMVDDDENMAYLMRFLLEREGYEILYAADGRQAKALIDETTAPQLVLLDVMLPYMSGLQLVRYIRSKPDWRNVPVIMLTVDATERDIARALDAGANDYVLKPFNPKELMARLRRVLNPSLCPPIPVR